jgi:peptide/nickel transport system ATP-binding protein
MNDILIEVNDLRTYFPLTEGTVKAIDGVSLAIESGRSLGVVGESGCGKSVMALSILRVVPWPGRIVGGEIVLYRDGGTIDLAALDPLGGEIRKIRGKEISLIFQEPMTAFSPVHRIGDQIIEPILIHEPDMGKRAARARAISLLREVGIPSPDNHRNKTI